MNYLCYVTENTNYLEMYKWMDKWCSTCKLWPVIIKEGTSTDTGFAPWYFSSYDVARNSDELESLTWVYLDPGEI